MTEGTWQQVLAGEAQWAIVEGDCLSVLPLMGEGCVDVVVTDPPYGVGLKVKNNDYRQSPHFDHGESMRASRVYNDEPAYVAQLIHLVMPRILRVSMRAVIFCGPAMMYEYPKPDGIGCVYTPNGAGSSSWGFQCCHPIIYYGKDPFLLRGRGRRPNSFRTEQPNKQKIDHPCPKPLEWMVWSINRASFPGDLVLDPFAGSGTTGVACLQRNRRFIGIEIDPAYCTIARERLRAVTSAPLFDAIQQGSLFES